jgi:hypothetical protein
VAPAFWNYYSDNITWPGTYILVANMLYHQYGDKAIHHKTLRIYEKMDGVYERQIHGEQYSQQG